MGREFGEALVSEERQLRPSPSFVYLLAGEIPPESYPRFAIEEYREEVRRLCERRLARKRRCDFLRRFPKAAAAFALNGLMNVLLFNTALRTASAQSRWSGMALDPNAPRSIAVLRSFA
jgi:hypothetical protein